MAEEDKPVGRFAGLPIFINNALPPGAFAAHNKEGELLMIAYGDGVCVDFRKEGADRFVFRSHATASFSMPRADFDKLIANTRRGLKLVRK